MYLAKGVQRDLLPLIEGCTVSTKYGMIRTDHILFIASGAISSVEAERSGAGITRSSAYPSGNYGIERR